MKNLVNVFGMSIVYGIGCIAGMKIAEYVFDKVEFHKTKDAKIIKICK